MNCVKIWNKYKNIFHHHNVPIQQFYNDRRWIFLYETYTAKQSDSFENKSLIPDWIQSLSFYLYENEKLQW